MALNELAFKRAIRIDIADKSVKDLRVNFNITKNLKKDPNTCDITIYNLGPDTRSFLEQLKPKLNTDAGIPVRIYAGYEGEAEGLAQLWFGDLRTALSIQTRPEWITVLTSGDGEKASQIAKISQSFGANTPIDLIIKALIKSLRTSLGAENVPNDIQTQNLINSIKLQGGGKILSSGLVLSGNTANILNDYCKSCGLEYSIQDGQLQILNKGAAINDTALQVIGGSDGDGIIGIPEVDELGNVKFRHIIKSGFHCGRLINLITERVKGFYKITKLNYSGDTYEANTWFVDVEASRFG